MGASPVPDGYQFVTPYLTIQGAAEAIGFYTRVFGATVRMRLNAPGGKVGHAELQFGDSLVMLSDEWPEMGGTGPRTIGGTPVTLMLYVPDADATFEEAVSRGAKPLQPVANTFYGDRAGVLEDPFGHKWCVSTHVEDVPPEELARRSQMTAEST